MLHRLKSLIYITDDKFGIADYRLSIVWIDKLILTGGILASITGRVIAMVWVVAFVVRQGSYMASWQILACAVLIWAAGEYFTRTGNRGLIYHHMDLLVDYLDRKCRKETNSEPDGSE